MIKVYPEFWEISEILMIIGKNIWILFLILLLIVIPLNIVNRKKIACSPNIFHLSLGTFILGLLALCSYIVGYITFWLGASLLSLLILLIVLIVNIMLISELMEKGFIKIR